MSRRGENVWWKENRLFYLLARSGTCNANELNVCCSSILLLLRHFGCVAPLRFNSFDVEHLTVRIGNERAFQSFRKNQQWHRIRCSIELRLMCSNGQRFFDQKTIRVTVTPQDSSVSSIHTCMIRDWSVSARWTFFRLKSSARNESRLVTFVTMLDWVLHWKTVSLASCTPDSCRSLVQSHRSRITTSQTDTHRSCIDCVNTREGTDREVRN